MKPTELATLFLRKGDQDKNLVETILNNSDIADEIVGFHCQQAVEKYLKSVLVANKIEFRKTHDIDELLQCLDDNAVDGPEDSDRLGELAPFAVTFRYDIFSDGAPFDRRQTLEIVLCVRRWAEKSIESMI